MGLKAMSPSYPNGPRLNFAMVVIGRMLPRYFPFDPLAFGLRIAREFGDIAFYQLGPLRVYHVNHPDLIRQVLIEQAPKFYKPRLLKRVFRGIAGDGLLILDGAEWRQQRKLMQPAFHHQRLAAYGDAMVAQAQRTMEPFTEGEVRDIGNEMMQLTLRLVVKCLFGGDVPAEAGEIREAMQALLETANRRMNSTLQLPWWIPTKGNLRARRAVAKLDEILRTITLARRASAGCGDDLLSVMIAAVDEEGGARMSDRQLRDEMMTLFLAGHETTANALTWTWYLLAQHPEVEAKLWEEVDRVLAGRGPTAADLANLPYTDWIVRESMRLYPPAPLFAREPIEDVEIGGYRVKKGSLIVVNSYAVHRDARFFPDPERCDPERFAPGREENIPRFAYLPFGGGPRVCIGNGFATMEARLVLTTIAQRWKLSLATTEEIKPLQLVTVRPNVPLRMRLERR